MPEDIKQNSIFQQWKRRLHNGLNLRKKHFLNIVPDSFPSHYDGKLGCELEETSTWITLNVGRDRKIILKLVTFQAWMKHLKLCIPDLL